MQIWANNFSASLATLGRECNQFVKVTALTVNTGLCVPGSWPSIPQRGLAPAPLQVTIKELLPRPTFTWRKTYLGYNMGVQSNIALGIWMPHMWPSYAGGENSQHQQLALIKCMRVPGLHPGFSELCRKSSRWVTFGLEHSVFAGYLWEGEQGVSCFQENKHCVHKHLRVRGLSWLMCWLLHCVS